ncbi:MAG: putative toxin-antitoxin system toxin component, PIN family [Betaproteobacteria bacterium RIFCSPHIGHO2_12_FULL_69_13]|nr:MAG: putative toxin-antitoxin system toxin component, PIN family [Betaproteobacteria bacterium RIFCSPHIGHO2_12_FULL_69_13]OGA70835.1 MAG: putative toxin-antitoxin system toxin component, PIN family [Betaproteobacteria bacterium RIFCSPLOWO2_12_FULL_68_20]
MRLVADTNTVVSALLWHGAPHRLLEAVEQEGLSFYASRALVDELADVLARRKLARAVKASGKSVSTLVAEYEGLVQLVEPRTLRRPVGRDPDDEAVIACALAARADLIVSGDKDLRVLKTYQRIRIVGAAEALAIVERSR